jgi:hypothetical protein
LIALLYAVVDDKMNLKFTSSNLATRNYGFFLIVGLATLIMADLFFQNISIWIFVAIILSFQLFYCNKYENAFIFIAFAPQIAGAIFISQGVSGIGGFFIPLGLILIWKDIYKWRSLLFKGYIQLFFIFILFGFSAYFNDGGDYYAIKLLDTFSYGTLSYIGFSILFINRDSVRFSLLAMIIILWSAFLLRFVIVINNIPGPSNLFHFGFMREQTIAYGSYALIAEDDLTIPYHLPGFLSLIGLSLFLVKNEKFSRLIKWYIWILAFMIIFYTGARQNLLTYFILLLVYLMTLNDYSFIFKSLSIIIVGAASIVILLSINSDVIQDIILSGTVSGAIEVSGRSGLVSRGLELFNTSPIWGIGFGHYNYRGIFDTFPHNFIIELLAEVGILGFSSIIILTASSFLRSRHKLLVLHKNNFKPYLILFPLIVRAMISGSMTSNIIVFSFIFSLNCLTRMLDEGDQNQVVTS